MEKTSKFQKLSLHSRSNIVSFLDKDFLKIHLSKVNKILRATSAVKGFALSLQAKNKCQLQDTNYFTKEMTGKLKQAFQKYESDPEIIENMVAEALLLRFNKKVSFDPKNQSESKEELYLNKEADYDAKVFSLFLAKNVSIKKIYLGGSYLGLNFEDFQLLCAGLGKNTYLSELHMPDSFIQLKNEYAECLADALARNRTLKVLDISQSNLGDYAGSLEILCTKGLLKNKGLDWLNLGNMGLGKQPDDLRFLGEVVEKHPTLRILNLGRNLDLFNHEANARAFCEGVKNAKKLQQLTLNSCDIGKRDVDMELVKEAAIGNKSLKLLNLNGNLIGGDFFDPKPYLPLLAEIIKNSTTIKNLRFSETNIDDTPENFEILADAIKNAKSVIYIECLKNKLWFNKEFQDFVCEFNHKHFSESQNL